MANPFLSGSNPVLMRELRAGLRNTKAFALIAIYVALLGALVTVSFPSSQQIDLQSDGGSKGQSLFWMLVWGQIGLVLMLIPALSTGALAQERERQTLEPLLLTPLSPLQIVWGKAGGVLSLVGLLLLASLPLTSLCFLLGGVSPGMLVAAYAGILGLAVFTTGFGLYCAARWPGATRALMACYALLPLALALVMVFLPLGSLFSGFCVLAMLVYGLAQGLKRGEKSGFAQKMGPLYGKGVYVLAPLLLIGLLLMMLRVQNIGLSVVFVGFVLSYFVMAAQWGLLQTARELMLKQDPEAPMRQKIADLKSDWQQAVSVAPSPAVYSPAPQTQGEWAALSATAPAPVSTQTRKKPASKASDSYGKAPFLSDKLNPIFARELRAGLLGKFEYLFRFSYVITILSELALIASLFYGLHNASYYSDNYVGPFATWGSWHLVGLMVFAAWFGARAIAPEREGQTLMQLFTIPMPPRQIIGGKMAAVLAFTLYVLVLALPLALLLPMTGLVPWPLALRFMLVELVLGVLAAAWGIYCSFHCGSVRSALSWALGGVAALLVAPLFVRPLWDILSLLGLVSGGRPAAIWSEILPFPLLFDRDLLGGPSSNWISSSGLSSGALSTVGLLAVVFYALLALILLTQTARNFQKMARET
ncbi:MAG TPA: ABC transporter permease [Abditibacterium sp.]|jgi:ABC-type transport system involved in multi-copper enzyme maturation permease subunit